MKYIRKCFKLNNNDNKTHKNLWDAVKAVLRGKFVSLKVYVRI